MATTKELASEAQRKYERGECDTETMRAAQREYDLERTAPQRETADRRSREEWAQQNAIWDSIGDGDIPRIREMATTEGCIREATTKDSFRPQTVRLLVPPTSHWANWRDNDAILYHGMTSEGLVERFRGLAEEPWDGTYAHLWMATGIGG